MKTKPARQPRNLSLDLLRICATFMIVLTHSIDHSGLYESLTAGTTIYYYEQFLLLLNKVSINAFVMISGYFLVSATFRLSKLVEMWVEVVFYALGIKLVLMATGCIPLSVTSLLSCFVPVITGRYWFVTIYFGLYLLFPFLNLFLHTLTRQQHRNLLLLLGVLFCGMISLHPAFTGMSAGGGWGLAWFVVLYCFAAYFRLHYTPTGKCLQHLAAFLALPAVLTTCLYVANRTPPPTDNSIVLNWWRYDSVPVLLASLVFLLFFLNCRISAGARVQRLVTALSSATFGVYLIHAHANVCTEEVWQALGMVEFTQYPWFPLYQLGLVLAIFALCAVLDMLRAALFRLLRVRQLCSWVGTTLWKCLPSSDPGEQA